MERAKAFFFVCAGMFLLALGYQLGARSAGAQGGAQIDGAAIAMSQNPFTDPPRASGVVGRTFYFWYQGGTHVAGAPVPGTETVIATEPNYEQVMLANGDMYQSNGDSWTYLGNLLGGATATHRQTWGALKARYR